MPFERKVEAPNFLFNFYDHFTIRKSGTSKSQFCRKAQDQ